MSLVFTGRTDPGRSHDSNEDAIGWNPEQGVFLVADGMGGHARGELASGIARDTILAEVTDGRPLGAAVLTAHERICEAAADDAALDAEGMGTTVVIVRIDGERCEVAWVGDSRLYLWRRGRLRCLTTDHSLLELLRARGDLSEAELRNHPHRNVVTQALGQEQPVPSTQTLELEHGDWLLLCSDGLNDELTDQQIGATLRASTTPADAVEQLVDAALKSGGRDNVSVVVVAPPVEARGWWERLLRLLRGARRWGGNGYRMKGHG